MISTILGAITSVIGQAIGAIIGLGVSLVTGLIVYLGQANNTIIMMIFAKLHIAGLSYWTYVFALWILGIIFEAVFGGMFGYAKSSTNAKDD